jgi:ethanolamine utilization protein EutQ
MSVRRFTSDDPDTWYQAEGRPIFLADVLDADNSETMSVGFARYDKGAENAWTTTYDEALIVTSGRFTVRSADGAQTADAGEVIYLTADTELVYQADEDTELVYVTYPHWAEATRASRYAAALDAFHPVAAARADRS